MSKAQLDNFLRTMNIPASRRYIQKCVCVGHTFLRVNDLFCVLKILTHIRINISMGTVKQLNDFKGS